MQGSMRQASKEPMALPLKGNWLLLLLPPFDCVAGVLPGQEGY
jgi:hypothetical protein